MAIRSIKTQKMLNLFRQSNGLVSYDRIEQEFGQPLSDLRPTIAKVRLYLERDEGIVFETERGKGYRRLSDEGKVNSVGQFTRRIRRAAGGGLQRLGTVSDFTSLSNADQLRATLQRATLQAVETQLSDQSKGTTKPKTHSQPAGGTA